MTFLGYILLACVVLSLIALLNTGAKDALRIDKWSDLFRRRA